MNRKQAKSLLAYGVLALVLVLASVVLVKAITSFSAGDSDISISYNLVTEAKAGRVYTPQCFTDCHLPYCFTPSGNSADSISVTNKDITQSLDFAEGSDQSILKEIGVDYLTTETYTVDVPVYGTCQGERFSNETGKDESYTYECITGSTQEQRTREVWKPLKDVSQLNLEAGKEQCFDIWGRVAPTLNSKFYVDVIPYVTLQGKEFVMAELATWNASVNYKRRHLGNYSYNATAKNLPCLINSSLGFGNGTITNYIWGKCDYNDTYLYYNSITDYYFINGSESTQLPMDTEGKSGGYDYNPTQVWDRFTFVILPNESESNSTGKVISSGLISAPGNFSNITGSGSGTATAGYINITSKSLIRTGLHFGGQNTQARCMRLNPTSKNYNCSNCTFEWIINFADFPIADDTAQLLHWRGDGTGTSGRKIGYDQTGKLFLAGTGLGTCSWGLNLTKGQWYYIALTFDSKTNVTWWVGNITYPAVGETDLALHNKTCNFGWTLDVNDYLALGAQCFDSGLNNVSLNGTLDMFTMQNITRSGAWITARYENLMKNSSILQTETVVSVSASESVGDSAILSGIENSVIGGSNSSKFPEQQLYMRTENNTQKLAKFDYVAVSGNQTWVFNYVTASDPTSDFTHMVNMTPVLYVWEAQNESDTNITSDVTAFINSTKQY